MGRGHGGAVSLHSRNRTSYALNDAIHGKLQKTCFCTRPPAPCHSGGLDSYITLAMAPDPVQQGSPDEQTDPTSNQTQTPSQTLPNMSDSVQEPSQSDDKASPASASSNKDHNDSATKRANAKDPSRPRRKKARRACYACQRAHLTCGTSALLSNLLRTLL